MNVSAFMSTLPVMAYGMGGIFLVILLIMGVVWLFNHLSGKKKENEQ